MSSFAYTTGNPSNLVANQNASMADIQGPFTDLRTFLNGGTMDETNVPNLAAAFTMYKRLAERRGSVNSGAVGTTIYSLGASSAAVNSTVLSGAADKIENLVIDLDPTEFVANSRLTKLSLRFTVLPNTVASGVTLTAGLYQVLTIGGAANASPFVATVGTVIAGSTVAIASPAAATRVTGVSGDFNCPAAGSYVIGVVLSGAPAATSWVGMESTLQMRQV